VTAGKVTDSATATGTPPLGGGTVASNRSTVTVREAWPAVLSSIYQPASGAAEGYYLGVTSSYLGGATSTWQLLVTQPGPGTVKFTGTITINHGNFTQLAPLSIGRGTAKASGNTITFSITNSGQPNGFKFATPAAASSITFTLDISAAPAAASQLYLGSPHPGQRAQPAHLQPLTHRIARPGPGHARQARRGKVVTGGGGWRHIASPADSNSNDQQPAVTNA